MGMGQWLRALKTHPHPSPPLEGEGNNRYPTRQYQRGFQAMPCHQPVFICFLARCFFRSNETIEQFVTEKNCTYSQRDENDLLRGRGQFRTAMQAGNKIRNCDINHARRGERQ